MPVVVILATSVHVTPSPKSSSQYSPTFISPFSIFISPSTSRATCGTSSPILTYEYWLSRFPSVSIFQVSDGVDTLYFTISSYFMEKPLLSTAVSLSTRIYSSSTNISSPSQFSESLGDEGKAGSGHAPILIPSSE